jgi:ATP-binding cassette subfamily B protein
MDLAALAVRALRRLADERALAFGLAAAGSAVACVQIIEALLFGRVVNALVSQTDAGRAIALWAALGAAGIAANVLLALLADRLAHRHRLAVLSDAFERALQRPPRDFNAVSAGELIRNILIGSDAYFFLWLSAFREQVPAIAAIALLFPLAFSISAPMTLTLLVLILVYFSANVAIVRRTQAGQLSVDLQHRSLSGRINDVMSNASVVHAFTRLHQETRALRAMTAAILQSQYPVLNWWAMLSVLTRASATVSLVSVFLVGSMLVGAGRLSIGEVVTFAGFASLLIARLEQAAGALARLFPLAPVMSALDKLLAEDAKVAADARKPDLRVSEGRVVFDHVCFTFPGSRIGLKDISFEARPGETIAIVGPTGSGKSTLLSMLQKIFEPDAGLVSIDGQDIAGVNAASVRAAIAVVAQETGLFDRSIADNLRIAKPAASNEELLSALVRAQLADFIAARPEGLDFVIGERGSRLSGGERQRLAIARAILKDAPILLLDEATSALDPVTEERVQAAITEAARGRTTFVIAHRLSTIRNADIILYLDDGAIAHRGGYAELASQPGPFRDLLEAGGVRAGLNQELAKLGERG